MNYKLKIEELSLGSWIAINTLQGVYNYQVISIVGDTIYTKLGYEYIDDILPIPLTPDILDRIGVQRTNTDKLLPEYTKYGTVYGIYDLDSCIQLVPDWRDQPSFHIGVRYTDSPFVQDEGNIYTFMYEIKYLHELQKFISLLIPKNEDLRYGDSKSIYDKLKQEDLFE